MAWSRECDKTKGIILSTSLHHILRVNCDCGTQVPTVLYYDQYQKVVGWGPDIADALAPTGFPKPGVQKVKIGCLLILLDHVIDGFCFCSG